MKNYELKENNEQSLFSFLLKKGENILKKFKNNNVFIVLSLIISIITVGFFFWDDHHFKIMDSNYMKSLENSTIKNNMYFHVDEFLSEVDKIIIRGYSFIINEDINKFNNHIILKEKNTQKYLQVPTVMETRDDVEDILGNGNKIRYSGFISTIDTRQLQVHKIYEVFYLYESDNNKILIKTDLEIKR